MGVQYSLYDEEGRHVLDLGKWAVFSAAGVRRGGQVTEDVLLHIPASPLLDAVQDWCSTKAGPVVVLCLDEPYEEPWLDDRTMEPLEGLSLWALVGPAGRPEDGNLGRGSGTWLPWPPQEGFRG